MATTILSIVKKTSLLLIIPVVSFANEMNTQGWNFPTPDESIVATNKMQLFCTANPSKCPAGLNRSASGGKGGGSALYEPTTSSSANQTSVTLVGDGNSVVLTASQSSENDQIQSDSQSSATIDYHEVLNY